MDEPEGRARMEQPERQPLKAGAFVDTLEKPKRKGRANVDILEKATLKGWSLRGFLGKANSFKAEPSWTSCKGQLRHFT